jgi:hypothetical protein
MERGSFIIMRRLEDSSNQKMHETAAFEKVHAHSIPASGKLTTLGCVKLKTPK